MAHFIAPMLFAFLLWMTSRSVFKEYTSALLLLSFAAFITYVLYPAAPPWMASGEGYLPPLQKVMDSTVALLGSPISMPSVYSLFRGDAVAAMPSLHAAYPLLLLLFAVRKFKTWGLVLVPYVAGVWFAVIYLGEHYFIDVLIGAVYAIFVFNLVIERKIWEQRLAGIISRFMRFNNFVLEFVRD